MGKINDTFNNKKKAEEPQQCFIIIFNVDKKLLIPVACNGNMVVASIYFAIVLGLEEFPDFKTVHEKQEYELRLNSQQIEKIFLKDDKITTLKLKCMEDLLLKDVLQLLFNYLKQWLDSTGYNKC